MLAVVTAVNNANRGSGGSPEALLDGFHAALYVSLIVALLGLVAVGSGIWGRTAAAPEMEQVEELEAA